MGSAGVDKKEKCPEVLIIEKSLHFAFNIIGLLKKRNISYELIMDQNEAMNKIGERSRKQEVIYSLILVSKDLASPNDGIPLCRGIAHLCDSKTTSQGGKPHICLLTMSKRGFSFEKMKEFGVDTVLLKQEINCSF